MIINNLLQKEDTNNWNNYTSVTTPLHPQTTFFLEKILQKAEQSLPPSFKDGKVLFDVSKALKLFLQKFASDLKSQAPSLLTLSTQTFREFDHERGCVVEYRRMSVDRIG